MGGNLNPVDKTRDSSCYSSSDFTESATAVFGCKRELSQARNICRNGSKVQEKDGNGAAASESAELL